MGERTEYKRNHHRVNNVRGRAGDLVCIDCGRPAADWSHRHDTDPADPANYDPRCKVCHARYDAPLNHDALAQYRTGRTHSPEVRAKISEGVRRHQKG